MRGRNARPQSTDRGIHRGGGGVRKDRSPSRPFGAQQSLPVLSPTTPFETISARILESLGKATPLDGLYLDLHGAMITASHDDGEGELLRRIRARLGPDLPIAVSLDMHANVTNDMVRHASSISIYRTYPHLDMGQTRCPGHVPACCVCSMASGVQQRFGKCSYIIPMHAQHTGSEPMRRLYGLAVEMSGGDTTMSSSRSDSPVGDIADSGPSILASAVDQAKADAAADALLEEALAAEAEFDCTLLTPEEAVEAALAFPPGKPVTIADVQDNPGGGASSDTTGLLKALMNARAKQVLVGVVHDPAAAGRGAQAWHRTRNSRPVLAESRESRVTRRLTHASVWKP